MVRSLLNDVLEHVHVGADALRLEELGVHLVAEQHHDFLVGFRFVVRRDLAVRAHRGEPAAKRVALPVHGDGKDQVNTAGDVRRHAVVARDGEVDVHKRVIGAGGVGRHVHERVRAHAEAHAHRRVVRLERLHEDVGLAQGGEAHGVQREFLVTQAFRLHLGGEDALVPAGDVGHDRAPRVVGDRVAAGVLVVAGDGEHVEDGLVRGNAVALLVVRDAEGSGAGAVRGDKAGSIADVVGIAPGDFGRLLGRPLRAALAPLVKAVAPLLDEVVVVEVLFHDDMVHGHRDRRVGAGADLDLHRGLCGHPVDHRVDDHELRAALHGVSDPEALEAVGVRAQRVRAPDEDGSRNGEVGVVHHLLVELAKVGHRVAAHEGNGRGRARNGAGVAGEQRTEGVRRAERVVDDPGDLPADVAAGAHHAEDRLAAIAFAVNLVLHVVGDVVEGFIPADALEGVDVAAIFLLAKQRVLQAVFLIACLMQVQAARAQTAVVVREQRVAFGVVHHAVLQVVQDAAAVVASGRGPLEATANRVFPLFPLELALVIELFEILLLHSFSPSPLRLKSSTAGGRRRWRDKRTRTAVRMLAFGHPQGESLRAEGSRRRRHLWRSSFALARARLGCFPLKPLRDDASMRWCRCTKCLRAAKVVSIILGSLFSQVDCENADGLEVKCVKSCALMM